MFFANKHYSFLQIFIHSEYSITETCGRKFFNQQRPQHVKLIGGTPHDMCLCSYNSNFIEAVDALQKAVPNLPGYKSGFIEQFLCDTLTKDCWFVKCRNCSGITIDKLKVFCGDIPPHSKTSWIVWKKSIVANRIEKQKETGTLINLMAHISALSAQFLRHSYVKREQSNTFNKFNFVCVSHNEIQNAHWNQRQLGLFTSALYYNEHVYSKVYVFKSLNHTTLVSIVPFMYKLLTDLPKSVKVLKIWSGGPSSQFKNKFIAAIIS